MPTSLTLRKEVSTLQDTELAALRDAYKQMMAMDATDNRGWMYWAGYHGFPRYDCWHHGVVAFGQQQPYDLFLPWHRAYLLYFEHTIRDRNPDAVLPWWDWTSPSSHAIGVPTAFSAPTVGSDPNPLFQGPVPAIPAQPDQNAAAVPAHQTLRFPGKPHALPKTAHIANLLKLGSFVDFSSQLQDVHDMIHPWVGGVQPGPPRRFGDMGAVMTSAFDPIFWSHHCMIDRLWYLWQIQNGNSSIPQLYLDKPLAPWALTVGDVLDVNQLGYEYAVSGVSSPASVKE